MRGTCHQRHRSRRRPDREECHLASVPTLTPAAEEAWEAAVDALDLSPAFRHSYIEPATVVGEVDGQLVVEGDRHIAFWLNRRYALALGTVLRRQSNFRGLTIRDRGWDQ